MKKLLLFIAFITLLLSVKSTSAQISISAGNTITQNFDTLGTTAVAALPMGWRVDTSARLRTVKSYSGALTSTYRIGGNNMTTSAGNGIYNFGAGDQATAIDRAIGGLSSSSLSKSVNVYTYLTNSGSTNIADFTISYDVEKYRKGRNAAQTSPLGAAFAIQMYYSTDGTNWTNAGSNFLSSFPADDTTRGYTVTPGDTDHVVNKTLSVNVASGSSIYLAWNYSVASGTYTSYSQALGIDNVSITANAPSLSPHKLSVTNVNGGGAPIINAAFPVTVQLKDNNNNPINATTDVNFQLMRAVGTGTIGGTFSGTIATGTNSVIVNGLTYNTAENGVKIYAHDNAALLTWDTSAAFNVINPAYSFVENHSICEGETYHWQGNNYTIQNTYTASYQSVGGLDSIYTLHLTVNPVYTFTENHSICPGGSYSWRGNNYNTANTYTDHYLTIKGCDSNYVLHLTVNQTYAFTENHSICQGETYSWHGNNYTTANTYTAHYTTVHNCDSVYTLNLTVNPSYSFSENHSICQGETYIWRGTGYTTANTYTAHYTTINNCDSNYVLHLTVNPAYSFTENHSICQGEVYNWHGNNYTTANTYTAHYTTIHSCDSNYTLNLTVNPTYSFTESHSICQGGSILWHGNYYTTPNSYTIHYTTIHNCDSSFTLNLTVDPTYQFTETHSICQGETYSWRGNYYSTANTYIDNYVTTQGCDSNYTLILSVNTVDIGVSTTGLVISADSLADGYQWLDCNNSFAIISGETLQSFTPTTNGSYAVKITQGACSDTSDCVLITHVGVADIENTEISVYPNPVTNELIIESIGNKTETEYVIFNSAGQMVQKGFLEDKKVIKTNSFAPGVYTIKLQQNNLLLFKKIVKE